MLVNSFCFSALCSILLGKILQLLMSLKFLFSVETKRLARFEIASYIFGMVQIVSRKNL